MRIISVISRSTSRAVVPAAIAARKKSVLTCYGRYYGREVSRSRRGRSFACKKLLRQRADDDGCCCLKHSDAPHNMSCSATYRGMFASSHGKPMLMNSKRVVHHHLDLTRERHQGALQARKQHLRAATLGGLVRWAAPKQIDAVVSGANEEAELACCKAELASRRASAAVRAAHDAAMSRRRAAAARIKPSLPHVDAERHLWDSALVHSEASERQSDAQAAHGPRQGSAAGDVGGSGAQAPVHITEHERRLDEALATDPPNLPVACSACGAVIDCLFRAGKLEAVLPYARRLLQVGERACVLRAQARAHEVV